jgi:hypothetical protein
MRRATITAAAVAACLALHSARTATQPATGAAAPQAPPRRLAIVLDTSSSMADPSGDPARRTVQLSKVLSDLVDERDDFAVITMPGRRDSVSLLATIDRSLVHALGQTNRQAFKDRLETITFSTSTAMLTPVRTAIDWLGNDRDTPRLLLILTDAAGFDCCAREIADELRDAARQGVLLATVGVGTDADALFKGVDMVARRTARNAAAVTQSVAEIYQRFLGGRNVTHGIAGPQVQFTVDRYVREAFLVVAADGPVPIPAPGATNPGADAVDVNFRGGHETGDVHRSTSRGYRIVRLSRPRAGAWTVDLPGLSAPAAFVLIQDYSLGLRLIGPDTVRTGASTSIKFGLFDENTGQRITDTNGIPQGLQATIDFGNGPVALTRDADGYLVAHHSFAKAGAVTAHARLQSANIDRAMRLALTASDKGTLRVEVPQAVDYNDLVPVRVTVEGHHNAGPLPDRLVASTVAGPLTLTRVTGAAIPRYEGQWRATPSGTQQIRFELPDEARVSTASANVEVFGGLRWPNPPPLQLGPIGGRADARARLDTSKADIAGNFTVDVTTDLALHRAELWLDDGSGTPQLLGTEPRRLQLASTGTRAWTLRLRTDDCPVASDPEMPHFLQLAYVRANGARGVVRVPLRVHVVEDCWYWCWRYEIALVLISAVVIYIAGGIYFPSRFRAGVGVQISDSPRLDQGVFYLLRRVRGARSGFYRDARVFVTPDYRVTAKARQGVVRLRAHAAGVMIRPESGASLARQSSALTWEPVQHEQAMEPGVPYRAGQDRLFFELRTN